MDPLTRTQAKYLAFIVFFKETRSYPPTLRDIGEYFGVNNKAVQCALAYLERKGYIHTVPRTARGIKLSERYKIEREERIEQWRSQSPRRRAKLAAI